MGDGRILMMDFHQNITDKYSAYSFRENQIENKILSRIRILKSTDSLY